MNMYKLVIKALEKGGQMQKAMEIIREMRKEENINNTAHIPSIDIRRETLESTRNFFSKIIENDETPDNEMCFLIIDKMAQYCAWSDALHVFQTSKNLGLQPNTRIYNKIIEVMRLAKKYKTAFLIYDEMKSANVQPDHATYASLLKYNSKSSVHWKKKWKIYQDMRTSRIRCSNRIYTDLIKTFRQHQLQKSLVIFQEMQSPTQGIYNIMIQDLIKKKQWEKALLFTEKMVNDKFRANSVTRQMLSRRSYTFIKQCEIMWIIFQISQLIELQLTGKLLTHIINNLLRNDQHKKALHIFQITRNKKVTLPSSVYIFLITVLEKNNAWDEVFDVFIKMYQAGMRPRSTIYVEFIKFMETPGVKEWYIALDIFIKMKYLKLKPDAITCTVLLSLMHRAMHVSHWKDGVKIFEKIQEVKLDMNSRTHTILIVKLAKEGRWRMAQNILEKKLPPDLQKKSLSYNILVRKLVKANEWDSILEILKDMQTKGYELDASTYAIFVDAMENSRNQKITEIFNTLEIK